MGEIGLTHRPTKERLAIIKKLEKENKALKEDRKLYQKRPKSKNGEIPR